ncbi:MAG: hypothetical protein AAF192_01415 [Pseudomonadota bacterium]
MIRRAVERALRRPFAPGLGRPPLVVHACHHKSGTVWFARVLRAVAARWELPFLVGKQPELAGQAIFLQNHSQLDLAALPPFRAAHMIRDPRDMIVSGFFYHKRTTEDWALQPRDRFGGKSYQEHLLSLSDEEGLEAEIRRFARADGKHMADWPYGHPGVLEMTYESMLQDEAGGWARLFDHWGFVPAARDEAVEIAMGFSLSKVKGKLAHVRSGRPNEWPEHFGPAHRALFIELTGDLAARLGYPPTDA